MKVHIVTRSDPDRVIPQMGRLLASATGWTVGAVPDSRAEINYALPYLELRSWEPGDSMLAAYFTHREDIIPQKVVMWRQQADRAAIRITSAKQYQDDLEANHGQAFLVPPPLDRKRFVPDRNRPARERPAIGVSGFCYGGGRKGESLLTQVLSTGARAMFDWRAIGRGWHPLKTVRISDGELPAWYRDLDLYVCPSLIEGIPYGPLEALASGVPIVIPRGVGLLDELPDMIGIFRYDCGDAKALEARLISAREFVLAGTIDREELRAATEPFTEEAWINGHMEAFSQLASSGGGSHAETPTSAARPPVTPLLTKSENAVRIIQPQTRQINGNRGIYIVAYGDPARGCAEKLIASVRQHMPGVPVAVASETPLAAADVSVYHPDADLGGRTAKTKMWELAPAEWEYVLYLDADTELTADVSFLFRALEAGWEMVATKDVDGYDMISSLWRRDSAEHKLGWADIGSDRALQMAGGVVGFRRTPETQAFLEAWYAEWHRLARRDQGALLRALYRFPVKLLVLGNEWNSFEGIFTGTSAGILHHRGGPARRVHRWSAGRLDDPNAWRHLGRNGQRRRPSGVAGIVSRQQVRAERGRRAQPLRVKQYARTGITGYVGDPVPVTYIGEVPVRRIKARSGTIYEFTPGTAQLVDADDVEQITTVKRHWKVGA